MKTVNHIKDIQVQVPNGELLRNHDCPKEEILTINEKLPPDFVEFYAFIGNSEPTTYSKLILEGEEYAFGWFHKVTEIFNSIDCYEDRMPTWLVPFSEDYMGNEFVISVREKDYGAIYLWEHDYEYDEDQDDCPLDEYEENLIPMASSFTTFILKMEVNEKYFEDE